MTEFFTLLDDILQYHLFDIAGTAVNVATLVIFALILGATFLIARFLEHALERGFRRWGVRDEGSIGVSTRLVHYLVLIVGFGVALHTIGINLTALFAAGAVFAIALGFAMQNIVQNFVSGIILLAERTIKPGDVLEVEGRKVKVVRLGIRSTVARTLNEEDLIIPNGTLVQSTVMNHTLRDRDFRLRAQVGVAYSSDMKQVHRVLEEAAKEIDWRKRDRDPVVLLLGFGSSSVDWEVSVWIDDPWRMQQHRSALNEIVWWTLKDAGITIAFPQLDLHLDPEVTESMVRRAT